MGDEQELATLKERVSNSEKLIDEVRDDIKKIKEDLMYRLPLWATALISVLSGAVAWFAK